MGHRKGTYKMVVAVKEMKAPCRYNGRLLTFEQLSCGHYHVKPEIQSMGEAVRAIAIMLNRIPQRRRCYECVSGKPTIPDIDQNWVKENN